ncbi:MAG: hypothetical protein KDA41_00740, partial [Planctomycetales bacterium]|nr:hypothetical protein [Planctomycetales bacterium]
MSKAKSSAPPEADAAAQLRRWVYLLLIVIAAGISVGRVFSVKAAHKRTPFLSANDRSRIATVRALVDEGTYAIDNVIFETRDGVVLRDATGAPIRKRDWHTIDMVRHPDRNGVMRSYSSKPTLLPTLLASEYWLIKTATGMTLAEQPFYVGRAMLMLTNVAPLVLYLLAMAWLIERYGATDGGRIFVMAAAALGTFVPTYAVTINNHLPATVSAAITAVALLRILCDEDHRWQWFALAGLFSAFTAANELPALSFFCLVAAVCVWKNRRQTLVAFAPAAAVVALAAFGTNYLAHASWKPPYAHRKDGPTVATLPAEAAELLDRGQIPRALADVVAADPIQQQLSPAAKVVVELPGERWRFSDRDEA